MIFLYSLTWFPISEWPWFIINNNFWQWHLQLLPHNAHGCWMLIASHHIPGIKNNVQNILLCFVLVIQVCTVAIELTDTGRKISCFVLMLPRLFSPLAIWFSSQTLLIASEEAKREEQAEQPGYHNLSAINLYTFICLTLFCVVCVEQYSSSEQSYATIL